MFHEIPCCMSSAMRLRFTMCGALLTAACLAHPFGYDENYRGNTHFDDVDVLLQTYHHVQPEQSASDQQSFPRLSTTGGACHQSYALDFVLSMDTLRLIGYMPPNVDCKNVDVHMLPQLLQLGTRSEFHLPPVMVVLVYGVLCAILAITIFYAATFVDEIPKRAMTKYPEADAWKRSRVDWLWMGWATQWIARWGTLENSALTKIDAAEIPLSDPDDEPPVNFKKFRLLWKEEIDRAGVVNASLLKVVTRFVTYQKVFAIGAWNAIYEGFMFLGPPLAIKWVTKYLNTLYTQRGAGVDLTGSMLVGPSLLLILLFTGLPLMMAISDSMCTMLNGRISVRIDGALSIAVYDKAQRLPVVQEDDDCFDTAKDRKRATKEGNEISRMPPEDEEFDSTPVDETEKQRSKNFVPMRYNLVQVITSDINANIVAIPNSMARMTVMIPVLCATLTMLIAEIGWAVIFSIGMAFLNLALMTSVGLMSRGILSVFYNSSGKRLQFLQEVLASIRFIKGSGAEKIVQTRLEQARKFEIRALDTYYTIMCFMFVLSLQFPKLYLLASLSGYALFHHGSVEPTVIMSLIPLLMSVQGAIGVVFGLVPTLVMAIPSCRRLEGFLKLKEAPRAVPSTAKNSMDALPLWVSVLPDKTLGNTSQVQYRLQGDFAWQACMSPTIKNLDVTIPQGKLVAILGSVGAGKTTFLHAMLGELHPHGDARIQIAKRIAYSAQVPHLFEGSLKENIIKGDVVDENRYNQAIHSACLSTDIKMFPGRDKVPVGAHGIVLSGGQKARVSMARAAYDAADLVLIDDPFAAVDAQTAHHLDEHFLHGPLMSNRTRIVCLQPDSDRIARFDWVIILSNGQIALQGLPDTVMKTSTYLTLLPSHQFGGQTMEETDEEPRNNVGIDGGRRLETLEKIELQEEECEGRASWATIAYFGRMGGWVSIATCILFYLVKNILDMRTVVELSIWMSHGSAYEAGLTTAKPNPWNYVLKYIFWVVASTVAWFICWFGGQSWTHNISQGCHEAMMTSLLHAPIDKFYDKTPTGRVMNRMANDMMNVDMQVFIGCCSTIGMVWSLSVPLCYVHLRMPFWFTLLAIPFYYLVISLILLYWKTMVPLRYLMQVSKSSVSSEIADVENNPASVRAYGMEEHQLQNFALSVRKMLSADFLGRIVCVRWLCNRLFVLGGCFVTCLALICVWLPSALDVGCASLIISTVFGLIVSIEGNLSCGSMAQYQIIAMNRVYEYTSLPEERENELPTDKRFKNLTISISRASLGNLVSQVRSDGIQILSNGSDADVLLKQIPSKLAFLAAPGKTLAELAPDRVELLDADAWHRITGVNGAYKSAADIAEELCYGYSPTVVLRIESGWFADGVKVEIKNLRIGYADIPKDVLQGVNVTIPRKHKVGIVGPTGCGKSTLFLSLVRILEPREGRIYLEGVDTQYLGLRTLRMAIGLVPQDPILLQGSLRFNIDPFELFDDARIWEALHLVGMDEYITTHCREGLDFQVVGEGANLSFGQRQLCSLARNVVRKPMLLLLDEATSAIDLHTQELLQNTIEKAFPDSTMIVIAHRLETILNFDQCVVMSNGRVVEKGSINELAKMRHGRFAKMLAARGIAFND